MTTKTLLSAASCAAFPGPSNWTDNRPTNTLLSAASALPLALAATTFTATPAMAEDCLLDRDNDGVVDAGTDNDGGASSGNDDLRLACGVGASAVGSYSTALGAGSVASGNSAISLKGSASGNSLSRLV